MYYHIKYIIYKLILASTHKACQGLLENKAKYPGGDSNDELWSQGGRPKGRLRPPLLTVYWFL